MHINKNENTASSSLTYVSSREELSSARCTVDQPAFVLPRALPFAFDLAAAVLVQHGAPFADPECRFALSKAELQDFALALPSLCTEFNAASLRAATEQIDFILADMQDWRNDGVISSLRFISPTGYGSMVHDALEAQFAEVIHDFHCDILSDEATTRICSYTQDVTQSISWKNCRLHHTFEGISLYRANDNRFIESPPVGAIVKFGDDWIHRAPVNAGPRLLLITN